MVGIIGCFVISYVAVKLNVEPKWILLYLSIMVAGIAASD